MTCNESHLVITGYPSMQPPSRFYYAIELALHHYRPKTQVSQKGRWRLSAPPSPRRRAVCVSIKSAPLPPCPSLYRSLAKAISCRLQHGVLRRWNFDLCVLRPVGMDFAEWAGLQEASCNEARWATEDFLVTTQRNMPLSEKYSRLQGIKPDHADTWRNLKRFVIDLESCR